MQLSEILHRDPMCPSPDSPRSCTITGQCHNQDSDTMQGPSSPRNPHSHPSCPLSTTASWTLVATNLFSVSINATFQESYM